MMKHIVKELLSELGLSFSKFESQLANADWLYLESEEEYMYDITKVANYIDIELHLKNCHA